MKKLLFFALSAFSQESETKENNVIQLRDVQTEGPLYGTTPPASANGLSSPNGLSSGDYLKRAGSYYLGSVGITALGTIFYTQGIKKEDDQLKTGGIICLVGGAVMHLGGHLHLINAGRAYNQEQITLSAASEGIGLAINF